MRALQLFSPSFCLCRFARIRRESNGNIDILLREVERVSVTKMVEKRLNQATAVRI